MYKCLAYLWSRDGYKTDHKSKFVMNQVGLYIMKSWFLPMQNDLFINWPASLCLLLHCTDGSGFPSLGVLLLEYTQGRAGKLFKEPPSLLWGMLLLQSAWRRAGKLFKNLPLSYKKLCIRSHGKCTPVQKSIVQVETPCK